MADAADEPDPAAAREPRSPEPPAVPDDAAVPGHEPWVEPPAGPAPVLPEPLPRPARRRWPEALKGIGFALGLAAILAGSVAISWRSGRLPYPTREQLETRTVSTVGLRERTTVTARCAEPDEDGARCLLRDREGRYGYSITTFTVDRGNWDGPDRLRQSTTWAFPLDARGRLEQEFELKPPWDLASMIRQTVMVGTFALGGAEPDTRVSCPGPAPGAAVTCTASGRATGAQLRQTAAGRFVLTVDFTRPGDAVAPPPP